MSIFIDHLTPAELGGRLKAAREAAKFTQLMAAEKIGISRTTLVAIEQGQRPARLNEVQQLALLYGTTANSVLRNDAINVDLVPKFRKDLSGSNEDAEQALQILAYLSQAEVKLESILGIKHAQKFIPEYALASGDVIIQAENDANELRHKWLGIGLAPIHSIASLLEDRLGIRLYIRKLPNSISGVYAYDEQIGACILLNANHASTLRLNNSGAHELGHAIIRKINTDVTYHGVVSNTREERYAKALANSLLMPARAMMQKTDEITADAPNLTRRHVVVLAHYFNVSREALVRRLEELSLVKPGAWDWFEANGKISDKQAEDILGEKPIRETYQKYTCEPVPWRLSFLAKEIWTRRLMSEGQLSEILRLDRISLRALLAGADIEAGEVNEQTKIIR